MIREPHKIDTKWREADIAALEERVVVLNQLLDHIADTIEMLDDTNEIDKEIMTRLRSFEGIIRSRRNDISDRAERLKMALVDVTNAIVP
jgi:hypothetical protein